MVRDYSMLRNVAYVVCMFPSVPTDEGSEHMTWL